MKLNLIERLITNNPFRAFSQRHIEGPMLKKRELLRNIQHALKLAAAEV